MGIKKSIYQDLCKVLVSWRWFFMENGKVYNEQHPNATYSVLRYMASLVTQAKVLNENEILMKCPKLYEYYKAGEDVIELVNPYIGKIYVVRGF